MQATLQTLYNYWNQVRAGRIAPQRLEIEPSRIAGILSETFMLERIDPVPTSTGSPARGCVSCSARSCAARTFLDGWSEQDRAVLERQLATIGEQGAVGLLTIDGIVDTRRRVRARGQPSAASSCRQDQPHHRRHEPHVSNPHWLGQRAVA